MDPNPRDLALFRDISARIQRLRLEAGRTQADIAEAAGVSTSYIAHIEVEPRQPTLQVLRRLAEDAFDLPVYRMFVDDRLEPDERARDEATRALNRAVHGLTATQLELLAELAQQMRTSAHKRPR